MNAIRIDGATRLYGIIGHPVAQVRSPQVFSGLFAAAGRNDILIPLHVLPGDFDATIAGLMTLGNLDGLLVTVPYKARMLPFASRLGETAGRIGAVNALRREADGTWSGEMFDGAGFVRGAQQKGERLPGRQVALYGAGGAGSAIACELAKAGVASLWVIDPQQARAESLVKILREGFPSCHAATAASLPRGIDMVVNASTVGMRAEDGLPGDMETVTAGTLIGDVVVSETPTPIIQHAIRRGCHYVTGRDMHSGQVDAITAFFARRHASPDALGSSN